MSKPTIISRENNLWVIDKPSGWVVHPTNDPKMLDLVTWAEEGFPEARGIAPINRIDRQTSGVVLMSPDPDLRGDLGRYFADAQVKKEYRALVYGQTDKSALRERKTIDTPLEDRRRGKPLSATTHYETLEVFVSCSYLRVFPETGRKHQIRRHLQGANHAVVGEKRYKPKKFLRVPGFPGRLWLHARWLQLPDGREFSAELPRKLRDHLHLMRTMKSE